MIYNAQQRYLFVHIQKNGGTSITDALLRQPGARFVSPAHLPLRAVRVMGAAPFVFAVVRNPWARLVSWFEMMRRKDIHNDFSRYLLAPAAGRDVVDFPEFIRRTAVIDEHDVSERIWGDIDGLAYDRSAGYPKSIAMNQVDYLTDAAGQWRCDAVLRFEQLELDFRTTMSRFYPERTLLHLSRLNADPVARDWRQYYADAADREWVARLYERDIEQFGFGFADGGDAA